MTAAQTRQPRLTAPAAMTAEGRLLKLGKRLAVGEITLASAGLADPVAHAVVTYALPPAKGLADVEN